MVGHERALLLESHFLIGDEVTCSFFLRGVGGSVYGNFSHRKSFNFNEHIFTNVLKIEVDSI